MLRSTQDIEWSDIVSSDVEVILGEDVPHYINCDTCLKCVSSESLGSVAGYRCLDCGDKICTNCAASTEAGYCSACFDIVSCCNDTDTVWCESCERSFCTYCSDVYTCTDCGETGCGDCGEASSCKLCADTYCEACMSTSYCDACDGVFCEGCALIAVVCCEVCDTSSCSDCNAMETCDECCLSYCESCCVDAGLRVCMECCAASCGDCTGVEYSQCMICGETVCNSCAGEWFGAVCDEECFETMIAYDFILGQLIVHKEDATPTPDPAADRPGVMKTSRLDDKPGANIGARTEKKQLVKECNYCYKKNGDLVNSVPLALMKCSVCHSTYYW